MKHYESRRAVCPFYKHEGTQMIYCNGVQEGTCVHLAFAVATDAKKYKNTMCYSNYHKCRIARMLEIGGNY